jgi:hypothetical protein
MQSAKSTTRWVCKEINSTFIVLGDSRSNCYLQFLEICLPCIEILDHGHLTQLHVCLGTGVKLSRHISSLSEECVIMVCKQSVALKRLQDLKNGMSNIHIGNNCRKSFCNTSSKLSCDIRLPLNSFNEVKRCEWGRSPVYKFGPRPQKPIH